MSKFALLTLLFWGLCLLGNSHAQSTLAEAQKHLQKASNLSLQGKFDEAQDIYKSLDIWYRKQNNLHQSILMRTYLANDWVEQTRYSEAEALYETLEQEANQKLEANRQATLADIYDGQGLVAFKRGHFPASYEAYKKALALRKAVYEETHLRIADSYNQLGVVAGQLGDYDEQRRYYEQALHIRLLHQKENANELQYTRDLISNYNNLSSHYLSMNERVRAMEFLKKALELLRQKGEHKLPSSAAITYATLGTVLNAQKQYNKAKEYIEKELHFKKLYYGEVHPRVAKAYNDLGVIHSRLGELDQKLKYYRKALEIKRKTLGDKHPSVFVSWNNLASHYLKHEFKAQKAAEYYQKAICALTLDYHDSLDILAVPPLQKVQISSKKYMIYALGQKNKALSVLLRKDTTQIQYLESIYKGQRELIALIERMRDDYLSERDLRFVNRQATDIFSSAVFSASRLYQRTGHKKYLDEIYAAMEESRAYVLHQNMREAEAQRLHIIPEELIVTRDSLRGIIAKLESARFELFNHSKIEQAEVRQQLFDTREELAQLESDIASQYPQYRDFLRQNSHAIKDVQAHLSPNQAFIEYLHGDEIIYTLIITKEQVRLNSNTPSEDFKKRLSAFRTMLSSYKAWQETPNQALTKYKTEALYLYEKLLKPSLDQLPSQINRLVIVPDGPTGHIPFGALLYEQSPHDTYRDLPFLIRRYAISYSYAGALWQKKQPQTRGAIRCLAFAPSYSHNNSYAQRSAHGQTLDALPGARKEVESLQRVFQGDFFFGQTANRQNFLEKAEDYDILHLAMHGTINPEHFLYSRLEFAQTDSIDNAIYAHEVQSLSLKAQLVVLSACQTGFGNYEKGEGVMSLARAFRAAGAASVLMTMWEINDEVTVRIIDEFYQNIEQGLPKDIALQQAKLEYLHSAPKQALSPAYWSAFLVIGDTAPLQNSQFPWTWLLLSIGLLLAATIAWYYLKNKSKT